MSTFTADLTFGPYQAGYELDGGWNQRTIKYTGGVFSLDFLSGVLDPRITFTRGTNATLTDSTGKLTYAPSNLLTYSERFDNAAWLKLAGGTGVAPTVTANAGVAPDGTTTADRVILDRGAGVTASDISRVFQGATLTSGLGIYSIWLRSFDGASSYSVTLVNGSASSSITVTGVWQRFSLISTSATVNAQVLVKGDINPQTADLLVWGAQLEAVTYQTTPSTYAATTSTAYYGPRFDYDPVTLAAKGLLIEEARTNLLTYSSDWTNAAWSKTRATVTANATTAPDGTANADKLVEDTTATQTHFTTQSVTVASGATVTCSAYAKAAERTRVVVQENSSGATVTVNLANGSIISGSGTVQDAGNGWYRIAVTGTVPATTAIIGIYLRDATSSSYTGDGVSGVYIYGAQLEAGAFATSYIPTVASTVTRSADVATMTGTNFSGWYNQSEGTFVVGADVNGSSATNPALFGATDGTSNNRINPFASGANWIGFAADGGVTQASVNVAGYSTAAPFRYAIAYAVNSFNAALNGVAGSEDTSGSVPVGLTQLAIGSLTAGSLVLNGHIRSIAYYNTRLPDAQLQALTA